MRVIILMAVSLLHAATTNAAPQFLTFNDGKIGVNFGGYHAEAGLGGLLTGNAAHGGLSASAGTPWGPKAAAGLGGGLDGRSNGLIYAGAEANPSVGASAVLGGSAGEHGFIGSEAHANGKVSTSSLSSAAQPHISVRSDPVTDGPATIDAIQKIKPPKKYHLIKPEQDVNAVHSKHLVKSVHKSLGVDAAGFVPGPPPPPPTNFNSYDANPGVLGNALNIPIGILRVIQESLTGIAQEKSYAG